MKKRSEVTQTLRAGCSKADPQTNKQTHTHTQTDRGDYNTLHSLAHSVMIKKMMMMNTFAIAYHGQSF